MLIPLLTLVVVVAANPCTPNYHIPLVQSSRINFDISSQSTLPFPQLFFSYTLKNDYQSVPDLALGIHGIQVKQAKLQKFMIKVEHSSKTYITFVFLYKANIWVEIMVFFLATTREDLTIGCVHSNFESLRGDRALTKVKFASRIAKYRESIGRVFLNGFSTNSMKNLQMSITQSTIKENQMLVSVVTGPGFDLKELFFSFIIFSPHSIPFSSYGRAYQQLRFKGKKYIQSQGNIYGSDHKFLGFTLLSALNVEESLSLQIEIDENFILEISAESFIDKFTVAYVVFGISTKQICSQCEGKYAFLSQCRKQCSVGSYQHEYSDGGKACLQCSQKLNEQINSNSTGCECTSDAYWSSGKCKKRKVVKQVFSVKYQNQQPQINQQILKVEFKEEKQLTMKKQKKEKCSEYQNTYWTGFRCACKKGFIPLSSGCQSFENYVKSLSYSSMLYPTQFAPTESTISQNPCQLQQLKINGTCICKDNYYRNSNSECEECPPHSTYQPTQKQCVCNKGYKLNEWDKCIASCPSQMEMNADGQCACSKGMALMNGNCITCDEKFGGYIHENKCYFCPGHLRFNGEKCSCDRNQIQFNNQCYSCQENQTPHNNRCVCFQPFERDPHTNKCQLKCHHNQIKVFGKCVNCPKHSHIRNNECICEDGFLFRDSMCVNSTVTCDEGQYKVNGKCLKCPNGCNRCASANECFDCDRNGFELVEGRCYEICGDGKIVGKEGCDDGNTYSYDGCSQHCSVEAGYFCFGKLSFCGSICGNGIITRYEQCDDGNKEDGDGCSSICQVEKGSRCGGQPSRCWK